MAADVVVRETPDQEEDGQEDESNQLERLAADSIDGGNGEPVTRNGTGADQNTVTSCKVVELVVDRGTTSVANSLENSGAVEAETVESDIEEQPRHGSSEQNLAVLELAVEAEEVGPGSHRDLELLD